MREGGAIFELFCIVGRSNTNGHEAQLLVGFSYSFPLPVDKIYLNSYRYLFQSLDHPVRVRHLSYGDLIRCTMSLYKSRPQQSQERIC
jgi:hypothetical protein